MDRKWLVSIFAVIVLMLGVSTAQADMRFNDLTCGNGSGRGNVTAGTLHFSNSGIWIVNWSENCGVGGTTEWEVQWSSDGGNHWNDAVNGVGDVIDNKFAAGITGPQNVAEQSKPSVCIMSRMYREKIWSVNDSSTHALAAGDCQGG